MTVFSHRMLPERVQPFWAAMQRGEFLTDAAAEAGTYREKGYRWLTAEGGVRPRRGRDLTGRYLSFAEREEIAVGRAARETVRAIAARLGRSPSTVSRETARCRRCSHGWEGGEHRAWQEYCHDTGHPVSLRVVIVFDEYFNYPVTVRIAAAEEPDAL